MPITKKVKEWQEVWPSVCGHPEHYPPAMRVFTPGIWEHTCPRCKKVTIFRVQPTWLIGGEL